MDNTTKNILKIILKDMIDEIRQNDDLSIETDIEEIKKILAKNINRVVDEIYIK